MAREKFTSEIEIKSSPRLLFQYVNTPGGLAQWFADDVNVDSNKVLSFSIDGEIIYGKIVSQKQNEYIKIEYLDEDKNEVEDPDYTRIELQVNDMTSTTYVLATDYNDFIESQEDHYELWEGLIDSLKDIVGA